MGEEKRQQRSFTYFAGREGEAVHVCQYVLAEATKRRGAPPPPPPPQTHTYLLMHVCARRERGDAFVRGHTWRG